MPRHLQASSPAEKKTKHVCHVICRPRIRRVRQPGRPVLLGVLCCSLVRGRSWPVLLAHGCLLGRHHVCSCFVHRLLRAHIEIGARLLTWPVLLAHGCIVGRHHVCSCFVHRLLRAHIGIGARLLRAGQRGESVRLYGPKWLRCFDYCEREWLSFSTCFLSKSLVAELLSIRLCTQSWSSLNTQSWSTLNTQSWSALNTQSWSTLYTLTWSTCAFVMVLSCPNSLRHHAPCHVASLWCSSRHIEGVVSTACASTVRTRYTHHVYASCVCFVCECECKCECECACACVCKYVTYEKQGLMGRRVYLKMLCIRWFEGRGSGRLYPIFVIAWLHNCMFAVYNVCTSDQPPFPQFFLKWFLPLFFFLTFSPFSTSDFL